MGLFLWFIVKFLAICSYNMLTIESIFILFLEMLIC
jgi:hypothetical protein